MNNLVASKFINEKANIAIIGDAAHQYPPSGGYGLNTGISDAFSLFWRIPGRNKQWEQFSSERAAYCKVIIIWL